MSRPDRTELMQLYRRRARRYDFTANLYYLIGFREWAYRRAAADSLRLRPGDTVVEMGCGTGLNFALLERSVGPGGKIVGVDLNDAMLEQARIRVARHGWRNVELVHADAADYTFPPRVGGVISTFAITLVPEYDSVVRKGIDALETGRRLVILDFKRPSWAPSWLVRFFAFITAPFGVKLAMAERHPWESLARYTRTTNVTELYFGFAYIAVGSA